jgi:hypothetical protein
MAKHPYKVRLRRVRGEVLYELLVPKSGSGWYVLERLNLGAVTLREAALKIATEDLSKAPLTATLFVVANPNS